MRRAEESLSVVFEQKTMPIQPQRHLRETDRGVIYRMNKAGRPQREIAATIGFGQSTVSKELCRNRGQRGYRPGQAQGMADKRKRLRRSRPQVIVGEVRREVEERLRSKHSPQQIGGAMDRMGGGPSYETIYQHIARDKKSGGDLWSHLRINSRRRKRPRVKAGRERIAGRQGLEKRSIAVEQRKRFGDWEADLIEGRKGTGYLLSLYERKSRLGILVKLETKQSGETTEAIIQALANYRVLTLTYDNGLEFSGHLEISRRLGAQGYFCAPYHSWEKGGVENFNGLVRQYYPKGSDFRDIDSEGLSSVERELNERPREILGFTRPVDYEHKLAA